TLSAPSGLPTTVNYATADGTATVSSGDYQSLSGTLTFAPGQTSQTVTVLVNGDTLHEANETFTLRLSGAVNAPLPTSQATGTSLNDYANPSFSVPADAADECTRAPPDSLPIVTLSAPSGQTTSVSYATADGTATFAGSDYQSASGRLTFSPGQT